MDASFTPIADHALLVTFAQTQDLQTRNAIAALDRSLAENPLDGVIETVPALVNILVVFDPLVTDHSILKDSLRTYLSKPVPDSHGGTRHRVHICYDGPCAPDLEAVAIATGQSTDAVINAHLSGHFDVSMFGFAPGYAYLTGVPDSIQVPRKPTALRDVPAGSVIIAAGQCLITTLTMPTGWSRIGRSPTSVLTGHPDKPFLFDVGDRVVFERIDLATFHTLTQDGSHV
ncbi:Kinase A inhibitor [Ascidiaceihabitans donghaensis]|uniref:Kinase A inhibitor n=1 Tax=Ascidiaceihabitans donghaensis TaxID=1510460 RepID=A0A2R8BCN7_9RHOB|nr:allophanate hydrolase subunit 1 [Ascidiaceihabitans donghaensis]SPH20855.1 Kinase A inhibitor [Ascidiaceihabitans donghaensis]